MGWGTRTPTSNDPNDQIVDGFARRLAGAYREPAPVEACRCRSYPKGTAFQELDDYPAHFQGESEDDGDRRYGLSVGHGNRRWVHMQHTAECIATRRADSEQAIGDHRKHKTIEIVTHGQDFLDGEWWCWK